MAANICFNCMNSVPSVEKETGCPWSWDFEPVPGWDAEPTIINIGTINGKTYTADSFDIKSCPLFKEG